MIREQGEKMTGLDLKPNSRLLIAHRGYKAKCPENTLSSFDAALQIGAEMIELDVTLTRDRHLVVIHDDSVDRTTNGKGEVSAFSLQELKKLDAGGWFRPEFVGETIPTLEEALDLVAGRALVNIEIKASAYEDHGPPDAVENQIVALVRQKNLMDSVLISSFEIEFLENIAKMRDIPALALISEKAADKSTVDICMRSNLFSWNPDHEKLTENQVSMMHDHGIKVFPYTVNTEERYRQLAEMGVDGVFTDDIPLLRRSSTKTGQDR